ncbi:MAG TPA: D-cysteine desulfhydrase family protein [Fimbriimonadaceae bacterium]|nr:D-cysteine desulfhydrase family protein [Fimbriimonadaceae bacterium]
MSTVPKVSLIHRPTPLHRLDRMSERLGIDLWIKRDDLTGFAFGGNKGRKLEPLMAKALSTGAEVVVTCGSIQSNFIRQLGAACAVFGVKCAAAVMDVPYEFEKPAGVGLYLHGGNVTLDGWLGVDLRLSPDGPWETLFERMEELANEFEADGRKVFRIPVGGSIPEGAYAFYEAGRELQDQAAEPFDQIVVASSSGSTQVGLSQFFRTSRTRVIGIASDPEPEIAEDFAQLSTGLGELIGESGLPQNEFNLHFGFVGPGYGIPSEAGNAAIRDLAQTEGIFLDPIYSGKAFAAVLELAKRGELSGRTCFWHTGGLPSLFSMQSTS